MKIKNHTNREKLIYGVGGGLAIAGTVLLGGLFLYDHAAGIKLGLRIISIATLVAIPVGALGWFAFRLLVDLSRDVNRVTDRILGTKE